MTNQEIFATQWNKLKEEMVELLNFQMKNGGRPDYTELNRVYKSKMQRWSSQMQPEGRWLNGLNDEALKEKMEAALAGLSLTPVETGGQRQAPTRALVGGIVGGAACYLFGGGVLSGVLGFGLGFAGGFAADKNRAKSGAAKRNDGVKKAYLSQFAEGEKKIAAVLEEAGV
ncbi:MAG: hypothetical protein K1W28_09635 [Lachnospiraceae bacterium]